jgi:transcriptional regulator with XRE-family HTH domain
MYNGSMSFQNDMLHIGFQISRARAEMRLSQKELAIKANITQQQLSKIENGSIGNMATLVKVLNAVGLQICIKKNDSIVSWIMQDNDRGFNSERDAEIIKKLTS